jgi:hypothetical protein
LKKALAFIALPLAFLYAAAFQSPPASITSQLAAIQSELGVTNSEISGLKADVADLAANNKEPRKFYLTTSFHTGAEALSACAPGYHMASMWEIHDPTQLRYNTELGFTAGDSGFGPPTYELGWIRTGFFFAPASKSGEASCLAWTSASDAHYGTVVRLYNEWNGTVPPVIPWRADNAMTCDVEIRRQPV